jgi:hypothetical protein
MLIRLGLIAAVLLQASGAAASATTCNSVAACVFGNNLGTGVAIEGVSQNNVAVYGVSTSNHGVDGRSRTDYGVVGYTYSTADTAIQSGSYLGKAGVYGIDSGQGQFNSGVLGTSVQGVGVQGQGATGVLGTGGETGVSGSGQTGVSGSGVTGAYFTGTSTALVLVDDYYQIAANNPPGNLIEGYGTSRAGDNIAFIPVFQVDNFGNETISGSLTTNANLVTVTETTGSNVLSYGARSASPTLEDVGKSTLRNGAATVTLDPTFASAIDTGTFMVFVTPHGNSNGLYTTNTRSGFTVHENNGGHSSLAFDYRIVAVPLDGRTSQRLPAAQPLRGRPLPAAAARILQSRRQR